MKKPTIRSIGRLESIHTADQKLHVAIFLSFIGHLLFCFLFVVLPKILPEGVMIPKVINVQLVPSNVTLPAPTPVPEQLPPASEAPPVVEPEAAAPKASTAPKPKDAISLATSDIETKRSMKKKTYKRERLRENALKDIEKRVEEAKVDPKQQALDRIREELRKKETQAAETDISSVSGQGKPTTDAQRIYIAELQVHIQKNWAFSKQLAGGEKNLYNEVVIKIMRNGEIADIWFDRRSGNTVFDDSTYKAILKSSPLPPIPEGIPGSSMPLAIRFNPDGLK